LGEEPGKDRLTAIHIKLRKFTFSCPLAKEPFLFAVQDLVIRAKFAPWVSAIDWVFTIDLAKDDAIRVNAIV
jgi:hypothetical protein